MTGTVVSLGTDGVICGGGVHAAQPLTLEIAIATSSVLSCP
jgi:hypothetical protein